MKYPFSQLIREISLNLQGLRASLYSHTASEHNAVQAENFRTQGGAGLFDFIGAPQKRAFVKHAVVVAPRNINQTDLLQLRKEGI